MSMKENKENYLEGIYGCLERVEKKVGALSMEGANPTVGSCTSSAEWIAEQGPSGTSAIRGGEKRLGDGRSVGTYRPFVGRQAVVCRNVCREMEKTRECLRQDSQAVKETVRRLDERMVLLKKEPVHKLVTYRLESASKAVVTTASALILALIISVWTNCNQYRTNRLLKDADLKYRAIRICLPGDDPDIAFLEKHFTIKRDEEKIRRVERLVTAFEDSVRNRIRNHEMAAYKDSLAHRLFREAQEIRKQLDNPNSK